MKRRTRSLMCLALAAVSLPVSATISFQVIAAEGNTYAGMTGPVGTLNAPFVNGNGKVGFTGSFTPAAGGTVSFVWYDNGVVWKNTDAAGLTGAEGTMGISNTGGFIYSPTDNGEDSVWSHNGRVLRSGDAAPGIDGKFISFASRPTMAPDGTAFWVSGYSSTPTGSTEGRVLYRMAPGGSPTVVMKTGDLVNGQAITASGIAFDYDFSDNGNHHAQLVLAGASTATDSHMLVNGTVVAQEGTSTGAGDNWQNFRGPMANNLGTYAFMGDTNAATSADDFLVINGSIAIRETDTLDGISLAGRASRMVALNNLNQMVHTWGAGTNSTHVFFGSTDNPLGSTLLFKAGDQVDLNGDGVPDATIMDVQGSSVIGPALVLADNGTAFVEVTLQNIGSTQEYDAIVGFQAVPEPATMAGLALGALAMMRRRRKTV